MREVREDLVIGGGPAGAAAAIQLARTGGSPTLLERKPEAHDKVCGEFISVEAAEQLESLGIDLEGLGAEPITRLRLVSGDRAVESALPFTAWSLSRRRLDTRLLECAEDAGVNVCYGTSASGLRQCGADWQVTTRGVNGERADIFARAVFLATGKHDLRQWQRRRPPDAGDYIGFKMHLRLNGTQRQVLANTVELHLFGQGYAGIEPVEDDKANLCFLVNRNVYHHCAKRWTGLLRWLADTSPHMEARLGDAVPLWSRPLAVYGTPYGYIHEGKSGMPGLFRLGDQMAVIPSLAGDGIAIALHSGALAAEARSGGRSAEHYHQQAYETFSKPVRNAGRIAKLLSSRVGRNAALLLGRHYPSLVRFAVSGSRLPRH